jgi:uncharacterized protein (TIGR02145 family)
MKKLFLTLGIVALFVACQKDTSTQNMSSNDVLISGFDCSGVKITGTLKKGEVATNVSATLTYTGGNAKTYITKSYSSTGVTGLTANLPAGTLLNGGGSLQFFISGTPASSGTATFSIAFGGKTCAINLIVIDNVQQPTSGYGPNISDNDGNTYKTVYIGTQQWMAENLKTAKYNDGTAIPNVTDKMQWQKNTTGAWSYHDNNQMNNAKYGKLYNWFAVSPTTNGNKNVCPTGWHVPTDAEWTVLTDYLGGESVAGGKMKEVGTASWNSPNTDATNTSLFTGLPGGGRYGLGNYYYFGDGGHWWSSTENGTVNAWGRTLGSSGGTAFRNDYYKGYGFSVRCLRD